MLLCGLKVWKIHGILVLKILHFSINRNTLLLYNYKYLGNNFLRNIRDYFKYRIMLIPLKKKKTFRLTFLFSPSFFLKNFHLLLFSLPPSLTLPLPLHLSHTLFFISKKETSLFTMLFKWKLKSTKKILFSLLYNFSSFAVVFGILKILWLFLLKTPNRFSSLVVKYISSELFFFPWFIARFRNLPEVFASCWRSYDFFVSLEINKCVVTKVNDGRGMVVEYLGPSGEEDFQHSLPLR